MSGFSAEWLKLREPVDHRSRNSEVAAACAAHFAGVDVLRVLDLGCGTGSNLRALAAGFSARQQWRLVDHDPGLLAAARSELSGWGAAAVIESGGDVRLRTDGKQVDIRFVEADLARDIEALLAEPADLVTATALFDLCSGQWLERFAASLAQRRLPLLATLTYDGVEHWRPPHEMDAAMLAAFHRHQRRDKGLGASAGPNAAALLAAALAEFGYRVIEGPSPWRLGPQERDLTRALAEGEAQAVRETGELATADIDAWLAARQKGADCAIGHIDLFATM